jgi:hypothetical protein
LSSDQIQTHSWEMGGWSSMNKMEGSFAGRNMNSKSWRIRRTVNTDANANSGNTQVWCLWSEKRKQHMGFCLNTKNKLQLWLSQNYNMCWMLFATCWLINQFIVEKNTGLFCMHVIRAFTHL